MRNKLILLGAVAALSLLPISWQGSAPTITKADARIGRPFSPGSFAGVHRRVMRRNFGVGWRGARWGHPVARAATIGAVAAGAGYYGGGYGGGCTCPSEGYGGGYGAPLGWGISVNTGDGGGGWGGGPGWGRPGWGGGGWGHGGWGGGWHRGWGRGW